MTQTMDLNSSQSKLTSNGAKTNVKTTIKNLKMSKIRIIKNLLVLSLGFLLIFSSYLGLANLQSTLNSERNAGLVSLSVLYAATIISSLFLPKLVIRKFGCKMTLVACSLMVIPYTATNFYPDLSVLGPAAFLSGLAAPPMWSSMSTYLNEISVLYSSLTTESANDVTARFFGIFFMMCQSNQIFGNMASYLTLKPSKLELNISHSAATSCGAEHCFEINDNMQPPSKQQTNTLLGIFLSCGVLGVLILAIFLDTLERNLNDGKESSISIIYDTLKHLKKTKQLLISPLTVFSGLEQGFFMGDFTKAYIACAWRIEYVGLVFMFFGTIAAMISIISGLLVKHVPRVVIMMTAAVGNTTVYIVLLLWHPSSDKYIVFFILAGIWGFSEGIWQTMLNSLYGILFRSEVEAAYSNYRLWESVGFSIAFICSCFMCVAPKIYLVLSVLIIGMMGYITIEILLYLEGRTKQERKAPNS